MARQKIALATGDIFGRLTIDSQGPRRGSHPTWWCVCACGTRKLIEQGHLRRGTRSCGCWRREYMSLSKSTHRRTHTPEYRAWANMRHRCLNPASDVYRHYGGRGITICRRWNRFEEFLADVGLRPSRRHSLERVDNAKGYAPQNVVWALPERQCNNTRVNVYVTVAGERLTVSQVARRAGLDPELFRKRLYSGWTVERAMNKPVRHYSKIP